MFVNPIVLIDYFELPFTVSEIRLHKRCVKQEQKTYLARKDFIKYQVTLINLRQLSELCKNN